MTISLTPQEREALVTLANEARRRAYAPYSGYHVGAALRTVNGRIFTGVNVEVAAYPNGTCAERTALFKAVSEGERAFEAIAVVTDNGGWPCGGCRQALAEFGLETLVIIADGRGKVLTETTVGALLPGAFRPEHLKK